MGWYKLCVVLTLVYHCQIVESASILALFSSLSFSDHLVFRGYVSRLVQQGHSVVMMTPYPGHFTYPDVERIVELDVGQESGPFWDEFKKLVTNVDDHFTKLQPLNELSIKLAIAQLKSKQMTALFINPNVKFDLLITEADVPVLYAAADKYKCPHIAITTTSGKIHQYEAKGNPTHPLQYPDVNSLHRHNLTYWQRFVELKRHIQTKYEYYSSYLPLCELAAQKILGLTRDLQDLENDIDLLLVSANPLLIGNRPTVPAIVYTDRLHIKPELVLPQNLQALLDAAKNGVIYFSLGAIQESEELSPKLLQSIADVLGELSYTVLWKISNTTVINKPDNVIAQPWFPQQEVLAHPNVKAFITHGGPRSLEEAVYYKVPIIGLPIVRSRKVFMREITKYGAGEIVDPYFLENDAMKATISLVASDIKYKNAMTKLKSMVEDPIISGPDNAVWWTEYVLRNGGARQLRTHTVGLSFAKYYSLDIITYLLVGSLIALWISSVILGFVVRSLRVRISGRHVDLGGKFKAL